MEPTMNKTSNAPGIAHAGPRREWITPAVKRLTAATAEFNVGITDDGPDVS
jgi:hypothetical protein